jgi:hypothetical protein
MIPSELSALQTLIESRNKEKAFYEKEHTLSCTDIQDRVDKLSQITVGQKNTVLSGLQATDTALGRRKIQIQNSENLTRDDKQKLTDALSTLIDKVSHMKQWLQNPSAATLVETSRRVASLQMKSSKEHESLVTLYTHASSNDYKNSQRKGAKTQWRKEFYRPLTTLCTPSFTLFCPKFIRSPSFFPVSRRYVKSCA